MLKMKLICLSSRLIRAQQWDHSQRKVVRYDHSEGDMRELKGDHGTKVACAAAGVLSYADHGANGVAEGSKLHIFDIRRGSGKCLLRKHYIIQFNLHRKLTISFIFIGGYRLINAYTFFESMHDTNGLQARIANGSWNTRYRAYPFSCKFFDEALHGEYQGDLFVSSAGNDGLDSDILRSKHRTIGNPASCKNTLAGKYSCRFASLRASPKKNLTVSFCFICFATHSSRCKSK